MTMHERKEAQRHIMVVDDDGRLVAELSDSLRAAGYRVTGLASGDDALEIAAQDAPDLAVLDVRIPDMSGIELGSQLRERSGVPFLCLSEYVDQEMVTRAAEEGALGYLVKPLAIQQIVPSIEAALTRGSDIRKLRENESQLNTALAGARAVSMAVGLLMMRDRINREQAIGLLRSNARSQRRPVAEVAGELLNSAENLYTINKLNDKSQHRKRSGTGS
jgi:response regulator NasT